MSSILVWQFGLLLFIIAMVCVYRFKLIPFKLFAIVTAIAFVACAFIGIVEVVVYLLPKNQVYPVEQMLLSALLSFLLLIFVINIVLKIKAVPRIHDITTDTQSPPTAKVSLAQRQSGDNSFEHDRNVVEQQIKAYPDIQPFHCENSLDDTFECCLESAKEMGWNILASESEERIIEATEESALFGFVDDIIIRVTSGQQGSRIDVRSASRVGVSDLGVNAQRIRQYFQILSMKVKRI
jgi:uncharacterized protein (DUF1499 family)